MESKHSLEQSYATYVQLLEQQYTPLGFYTNIALLLHSDRFFVPGYLELIWGAEQRGDKESVRKIALGALEALRHLLRHDPQLECVKNWTPIEITAFRELVTYIKNSPLFSFTEKILTRFVATSYQLRFPEQDAAVESDPKHLVLLEQYDPALWKEELNPLPYFWWQIDNARAQQISFHQHTHSIALRRRVDTKEEYSPQDGPHESVPTPHAHVVLPSIQKLVLDFAKQQKLGLGAVNVVALKPGHQIYRHYDTESHLRGRKRYHLVLRAGPNNMLSSGTETVEAKTGELWFFDNMVMHRTQNKSKTTRIHVIFDGYPLS